jgi:ankyrin repeat protein
LIETGIDVNCKDKSGINALLLLCKFYEKENLIYIIQFLIGKGIDLNFKDNNGNNALHLLCGNYQNENLIDILRILIENGIHVDYEAISLLRVNYRKENCSQIVDLLNQQISRCIIM